MVVTQELRARVERGELAPDAAQERAAGELDRIASELTAERRTNRARSPFARWRRRHDDPRPVTGAYIFGGVGRGKSMLMDLFFAKVALPAKRRVHFHAFMLEINARLHAMRQEGGREDPLSPLAEAIAQETRLLCFDEFHVVNIADAMILGRLFTGLFAHGTTVVATSNWPPGRLYENGLNRDRFLPFIDLLLEHVAVVPLEGGHDYRLDHLVGVDLYLDGDAPDAPERLAELFSRLSGGAPPTSEDLAVGSRTLPIPCVAGDVAMMSFKELCDRPLGAADYLALTARYHALVLSGVPVLTPARRNEARRFMTLVDALYERKVILAMTAAAAPEGLYPEGDGAFEFRRTVSRLVEMRSRHYLEACAARNPDELPAEFVPYALTSDLT